ncbi:ribosomal protein S8 [Mesoflavibacter sabulilitoris]|uniref:Uncharacterized protein n=1 Tax=Mesoflavibacter zeaxanthinifaciens subsp. sabulilitoris TaxID=1520893 RepID=A0A2T1NNN2_9FLAO|nr:hypothetical protein [Mesoflavibacter zeaxanthinifaciens]MBB3125256.1 ribosomal protein S8 [Mesoflavibacter zeaxanthinifaciens subsp. sabulilitoris]PSG94491.1 hypothetical protein C7H61_00730 [Mesoflavibacter zeaxanthinifaciens subsp. sabulilitoris]
MILWKEFNNEANLPAVFEYLKFKKVGSYDNYIVYSNSINFYVVYKTLKGFYFYNTVSPEKKLQASDAFEIVLSKKDDNSKLSIWEKIDITIKSYEDKEIKKEVVLDLVDYNFNHFELVENELSTLNNDLFDKIKNNPVFNNSYIISNDKILYPLYNINNTLCGYLTEENGKIIPTLYTNPKYSLWFSNTNINFENIIVLNSPKEAISFHNNFKLDKIVFVVLSEINNTSVRTIKALNKISKSKKIIISFTGNNKTEGFIKDLKFLEQLQDNFSIKLLQNNISITFKIGHEKSFLSFYNQLNRYNKHLGQQFNNTFSEIDQFQIDKYAMKISKDNDFVSVKLPIEINALKHFIWNYTKQYLANELDVLKPKARSWEKQLEQLNLSENENIKDYKIAM